VLLPVFDAVDAEVGAVVVAHASEADRIRRLPTETVEALAGSGAFQLGLPVALGGPGLAPTDILRRIASLARLDGAAGWCSMISSTTSTLAAFLRADVAEDTFGKGRCYGGVFAPNGRFSVDGTGATLSGRWNWGSGLQHCDVVVAGAIGPDGERRTFILDIADVELVDTWHTMGMRGSGSVDFVATNVSVDLQRSASQIRPRPIAEEHLSHFPNFALLAASVAAVAAGIASHAIEECRALAVDRRPQFSSRLLAEHAAVQSSMSRVDVALGSAVRHLWAEVDHAWQLIVSGERVAVSQRVAIRAAAAHLVEVSASVTDEMFTVAGGNAVYETSDLGRCLRDAHVVRQHIMVAPRLHETLGRHLLGLELDDAMI
jgi:alkylation response protein AidB-like acyl-CoA dehydrogenase